ncbi:hypothetical protein [Haloarchaeobius sp. DFWS5]|uniref:hypothetical protein n=1 Tax=Haloarchaeobius sp. DFWS5 TaxID=3446114 RepID=UPI003EBDE60E
MSGTVASEPVAAEDDKSEIVAAVASLIIPGLGQFYLGDTQRGLIWFGATVAWSMLSFVMTFFLIGILMFFALPLFNIGAAVDAYMQGSK